MGLCCSSGLLFRPKLEYLLSPTPIQLPLLGSEFALQIRLNSSPRHRRPHKKNKFPQKKKKEKKRSHSCQPKILYAKFYLESQSDMSSIIKKKKNHTLINQVVEVYQLKSLSHHIVNILQYFQCFFFLPNKASNIGNQQKFKSNETLKSFLKNVTNVCRSLMMINLSLIE